MDAIGAHRAPATACRDRGRRPGLRAPPIADEPLGAIGDLGALSFHETKNVICGEGGALLVNDPSLSSAPRSCRRRAPTGSAFFRGQVDKYTWVDVGSSFVLGELAAAFLWAQIEQAREDHRPPAGDLGALPRGVRGRSRRPARSGGRWSRRTAGTTRTCTTCCCPTSARPRRVPRGARRRQRDRRLPLRAAALLAGRAQVRPADGELPVTDDTSARLLRLPLWVDMCDEQTDHVIGAVRRAVA